MAAAIPSAVELLKLMPYRSVGTNVDLLSSLVDEDALRAQVDCPATAVEDTHLDKPRYFLTCDYNRDGDNYRSPWSNVYFPPIDPSEEPLMPPTNLRAMEVDANELFAVYAKQYFGHASISSVYFFELAGSAHGTAFGSCWLVKKEIADSTDLVHSGSWDSKHDFTVHILGNGVAKYELRTHIMLGLVVKNAGTGSVDLTGHVSKTKVAELKFTTPSDHIANMGGMLEELETSLRSEMDSIYIGKTQDIMNRIRVKDPARDKAGEFFVADLAKAVAREANMRK